MQGFRKTDNALIREQWHETIQIEPWGQDSLRVRVTTGAEVRDDLPGALLPPDPVTAEIEIEADRAVVRNGAVAAEISRQPHLRGGRSGIRFFNTATGEELLAEAPAYFPKPAARGFKSVGGDLYRVEARFQAYEGERLYGLGQHQHGLLDQKGAVVDLLQYNTEVCIPFLLSNRGYGFLWHNPAVGRVELGRDVTRWVAEATAQMDYWITVGDTPAKILANYADATGHAPPFPEWAAGFWQCKLRYRTQDELMDVAREQKRRGLPLSVIVSDFFNWSLQGDWHFDPESWPDPEAMVRELEEMGVKLMVSIWPTVNALSENFLEMQQRGLLIRTERGVPAHMPFVDTRPEGPVYVHYYDATNPEARQFIWEQAREGYYRHGIKVWWLDACEPEISPRDPENLRFHLGNGLAVMNIYPLLQARGFYEGMRAEGEEEILTLCRSAWAGSQRYGAALWSGDIPSTFEALQIQIPAGLNAAMSGIPWWNTDIGGFFNGDITTPYFRELIVRWFQYGVFCPICRLHGYRLPAGEFTISGADNEVWSFGDEASWTVDDQYMFGPDLLVAPVLFEGARSRDVYLPAGAAWTDAWTGATIDGGQSITADAPLDRIPLYLRDGAKLPIHAET